MLFTENQVLRENNPGKSPRSRWRVLEYINVERLTLVRLEDVETPAPLARTAVGACVNAFDRNGNNDPFSVLRWVNEFRQACECCAGNFAGLPEPLDYFDIRCSDRGMPGDLAEAWPFIVYCYPKASQPNPLSPNWVRDAKQLYFQTKRLACAIGHTMKALHEHGILLGQVKLENIRVLPVTKNHIIAEFFAMRWMGTSEFDPHRPSLVLKPGVAAPEHFRNGTNLSASADVYALAALLLEYMGISLGGKSPEGERDVIQLLQRAEDRFRLPLSPEMIRAMKLALLPDAGSRPQTMGQFLAVLSGADLVPQERRQANIPQRNRNNTGASPRRHF
jgi:hypothetical protein